MYLICKLHNTRPYWRNAVLFDDEFTAHKFFVKMIKEDSLHDYMYYDEQLDCAHLIYRTVVPNYDPHDEAQRATRLEHARQNGKTMIEKLMRVERI